MPAEMRPFPMSVQVLINHLRDARGYLIEDDVRHLVSWIEGEPARYATAHQEGYREGLEAAVRAVWKHEGCVVVGSALDAFMQAATVRIRTISPPPAEPSVPVAPDDGWIEWKGGECPVERGDVIDVRYRDGMALSGNGAGWDWQSRGEHEIVAYRIVKPASAPVAGEDPDATYHMGVYDGREETLQLIDVRTGGDGEYRGSTIPGETVDDKVMERRIIERFTALKAENARLREGLEFYADEENHRSGPGDNLGLVAGDYGRRARALLQGGSDAG